MIIPRRGAEKESFKSCPRVGGIIFSATSAFSQISFKSCPRVGGIRPARVIGAGVPGFKSCPRVGGIFPLAVVPPDHGQFQVVPPCGGHLKQFAASPGICKFQVVPPCGGHRFRKPDGTGGIYVSSRAPVWGASRAVSAFCVLTFSFKSCPRVGGISGGSSTGRPLPRFQVVPPCWGHPLGPGGRG